MEKLSWDSVKWKILYFVIVFIVIPTAVGLIVTDISRRRSREKVEISLEFMSWETVAYLEDNLLLPLELSYQDSKTKNVLKIIWKIKNTGTKGIDQFEINPIIRFPKETKIIKTYISDFSTSLKIGEDLKIDNENRGIIVGNLGVFNKGEYFDIEVFISDVPNRTFSMNDFNNWNLRAKATDLFIKKIKPDKNLGKSKELNIKALFLASCFFLLAIIILTMSLSPLIEGLSYKLQKKRPKYIFQDLLSSFINNKVLLLRADIDKSGESLFLEISKETFTRSKLRIKRLIIERDFTFDFLEHNNELTFKIYHRYL